MLFFEIIKTKANANNQFLFFPLWGNIEKHNKSLVRK